MLTPKEARQLWVEALVSGKYLQGQGWLCVVKGSSRNRKYCCLGVACELYQEYVGGLVVTQVPNNRENNTDTVYLYDYYAAILPDVVQDWLGLATNLGQYSVDCNLSYDNDEGVPFEDIAATILAEPRGLIRGTLTE